MPPVRIWQFEPQISSGFGSAFPRLRLHTTLNPTSFVEVRSFSGSVQGSTASYYSATVRVKAGPLYSA